MPFPNLLPLGSPLPSEGLGEAFPFGEGMGVRLWVEVSVRLAEAVEMAE
ncbi:hypothetical protein [Prevotella sp.]